MENKSKDELEESQEGWKEKEHSLNMRPFGFTITFFSWKINIEKLICYLDDTSRYLWYKFHLLGHYTFVYTPCER
jgi:hypothetical protein